MLESHPRIGCAIAGVALELPESGLAITGVTREHPGFTCAVRPGTEDLSAFTLTPAARLAGSLAVHGREQESGSAVDYL